jgi:predicted transcriptional regulator of viral defense system
MSDQLMSIEDQVFKKIKDNKRGKIFFPASFSNLGSEDAIHQALKRLTEKGILFRIAHGIYLYPKTDPELGILVPPHR